MYERNMELVRSEAERHKTRVRDWRHRTGDSGRQGAESQFSFHK